MKTKKQRAQESEMPPGKVKAPKPQLPTDLTQPVDSGTSGESTEQAEHKVQDEVIAPDGEPETKKEPEPLF